MGLKHLFQKLLPTALSPEKKYGYALVAAMALVAAADGTLEEAEVHAAERMIDENDEIRTYLTTDEAHRAFKIYIDELMETVNQEKTRFDVAVDVLMQKIPHVEKEEWKHNIIFVAKEMAMADGDLHENEEIIIEKIASSLWQSYKTFVPM